MEVYKKSYTGFVIWLIGFCVVVVGACFLPNLGTQLTLAVVDNASTIGIFILTLLIYQTEYVYWYNGTSYEEAKAAGSERKVRAEGISVLGVFAGEEEDLQAERRIFGRDFAYIRNIMNFSSVVGRYLKRQLDDTAE